jgi:hypothetical protein
MGLGMDGISYSMREMSREKNDRLEATRAGGRRWHCRGSFVNRPRS